MGLYCARWAGSHRREAGPARRASCTAGTTTSPGSVGREEEGGGEGWRGEEERKVMYKW